MSIYDSLYFDDFSNFVFYFSKFANFSLSFFISYSNLETFTDGYFDDGAETTVGGLFWASYNCLDNC